MLGKGRTVNRPAPEAPSLTEDAYLDMLLDVEAEERNSAGSKSSTL